MATDKAGNASSTHITYTYDVETPVVNNIVTVNESSKEVYSNQTPVVGWSSVDDSSNGKINYTVSYNDGTTATEVGTGNVAYTKGEAGSTELPKELFTTSGLYNIIVYATDNNNNKGEEAAFDWYYDGTAPEVANDRLIAKDENGKATITMTVTDDINTTDTKAVYTIVKSDVEVSDTADTFKNSAELTTSNGVATFSLTESDIDLDNGVYKVLVSLKDGAGNYSAVKEYGYYKFDGVTYDATVSIDAGYSNDNGNIQLAWDDDETITKADLYVRYGSGQFALVNTFTDAYTTEISAEKIETTAVDTDEDGIEDSYELWELNSNLNAKDTDGDGLDDYYEVTYLGTNVSLYTADVDSDEDGLTNLEEYNLKTDPYRADSDFDCYNDKADAEPLKTDLSNRDDYTSYTTDVHMGMYDIKTTEIDEDETLETISNVYGGVTKWEDYNGAELAGYIYSASGIVTGITGDEELAKSNPWRYRGYYYDEEIGMYYLQSRYYDAEVGRFLNADDASMLLLSTFGLKGMNLYEYCNNNVVNENDGTGYWPTLSSLKKKIIENAKSILKKSRTTFKKIGNKISKYLKKLSKTVKKIIANLLNGVSYFGNYIINTLKTIVGYIDSLKISNTMWLVIGMVQAPIIVAALKAALAHPYITVAVLVAIIVLCNCEKVY